ncbi:hypothetical protein [Streptomyces sp. NRRL S-350]|uniref:hypothetical protein n=1 Tax=Streptomyces sp. NRRL S-350 TaxID=1463902 RepID=UPI00131CCE4F|nr:hypothetical protein [Streptomyces sp. NRRL S-350]
MTKNNPADSALRDQIDAAAAESDAFLTARGASAPVSVGSPTWQRPAMEALVAAVWAGTARRCAHIREDRLVSTPTVLWIEAPETVCCPPCDLARRLKEARTCQGCGARGTLEGGVEYAAPAGPMSVTAVWCPTCPPPALESAPRSSGASSRARAGKKRSGRRGR